MKAAFIKMLYKIGALEKVYKVRHLTHVQMNYLYGEDVTSMLKDALKKSCIDAHSISIDDIENYEEEA